MAASAFLKRLKLSRSKSLLIVILQFSYLSVLLPSSGKVANEKVLNVIYNATKYLDENVSYKGCYVWAYTLDMSRRWGEMEAYPTMGWVQGPGTVEMGNTFLDIYEATGNKYYLDLAEKSAHALIEGQLECGGWNYLFDLAGESSIEKWYDTIAKNGWRLEEFQHYYGNATFDDASTPGAATFILRMYLTDPKPEFKSSLDKAIHFFLESQYPNGSWPQRFPLTNTFNKNGNPDYTPYYTFNDNVIWNNINFLIQCYKTLHEPKLLNHIIKGMDFYMLSQQPVPQAGWAQQYSLDLKPAGARTYEPKSLDPQYTAHHIEMLIKFYQMTGDEKYISRINDAMDWLSSVKLGSRGNFIFVPKFVEVGTNKAIYTHRIGTNVECGKYYFDYDSSNTLKHYRSVRMIDMKQLRDEVSEISSLTINKSSENLLYIPGLNSGDSTLQIFHKIDDYLKLPSETEFSRLFNNNISADIIISQMDKNKVWTVKHAYISNPYIGEPVCIDSTTTKYSQTNVGDKYDTSPYPDTSNTEYISTGTYIRNIHILLKYLSEKKTAD